MAYALTGDVGKGIMAETTTETLETKPEGQVEGKETTEGRKSYDEGYVKSLRDESRKRMERAQAAEAERDALKQKVETAERAELEKKGELQALLEKEREDRKKIETESKERLSAADRRYILAEAKALAIREGIIDPSDVRAAINISDLRIDDDDEIPGLAEKIAELKTAKPHWFKGAETKPEGERKRAAVPPERKPDGTTDKKDWRRANNDEFRSELQRFGVSV